jgi:single-strand DNA-binding protein
MSNFNKVILMGNLTRDPQLRYLANQTAVADFGVACNRRWKGPNGEDKEEVTFVDVTAWGKQAEVINQYFQKGKPIFVEGRLKYDTWDDKQGGGKRSKLSVVIENFQFVGGRDGQPGGGGGGGGGGGNADYAGDNQTRPPRPQQQSRPAPQRPAAAPAPEQPFGDEQQFKEDDIPF